MTNDSKSTFISHVAALIVRPINEPIFSELVTKIYLDDQAAGLFVVVEQNGRESGKVSIGPEDWPMVRSAIDTLMEQCHDRPPPS